MTSSQRAGQSRRRRPRKKAQRRVRIAMLWPSARLRRRALRAFHRIPRFLQVLVGLSLVVILWFAINWIYQVVRKPSELFFPVSGTLNKIPAETWRQYGSLFQRYSTDEITPELLAALAQVEGSGNPVAQTYWRWSWKPAPFDMYRPASSAVGMYQITNGTFAEARRYCIRRHAVVEDGPWKNWDSCWFNDLYTRVLPSHAVELTSVYLDRSVASALQRYHPRFATLERKQELAAVIHLCGAGAGDAYVRRGMRLTEGERCGDHDARNYVARVTTARHIFEALRAANPNP
jgi:Transglycosylase SLT domain